MTDFVVTEQNKMKMNVLNHLQEIEERKYILKNNARVEETWPYQPKCFRLNTQGGVFSQWEKWL